jgi:hypothetical protein
MNNDYLKYWRVIRYFVKAKYDLNQGELDVILFLNSEGHFGKDKFDEFDELLSWDKHRFKKLLRDGWIQVFRKRCGPTKTLYILSYKSKRLVLSIYKKLSGEEIPTSLSGNPMFAKNVKYTDKVYRNFIKEINAITRQQRHRAPE